MASLTVTMKGQVILKRDLLQHLGVKPGERVDCDKMPGGELRVRAARPAGTIENFIGRHAGKVKKPVTIEGNERAGCCWRDESTQKRVALSATFDQKMSSRGNVGGDQIYFAGGQIFCPNIPSFSYSVASITRANVFRSEYDSVIGLTVPSHSRPRSRAPR